MRRLAEDGARVLITADCGITALQEVAAARDEYGLDVVVLDHHEPAESLPDATAIVTPKHAPSGHPLSELSTGGLAYRVAHGVAERMGLQADASRWLDLAAMSTVADVVPLRGENRWIVHQGLRALADTERPGLRTILQGRRSSAPVDTETIGFTIAPLLNAAGRLADASLALDMLLERDASAARELTGRLESLNQERRRLTDEAMREADRQIAAQTGPSGEPPLVVFVGSESMHHGIVGIVAGRLADAWSRPAFAWSLVDGEARASGRSAAGFDLVRMLDASRDLLIRGGGHQQAAGFSCEPSQLGALLQRFNETAQAQLDTGETGAWDSLEGALDIDAQVPLSAVTHQTVSWIERLAPFGEGNPAPTFLSTDVGVREARTMGQSGDHLLLALDNWSAVGWRLGEAAPDIGRSVDIVWRLRRGLRGRVELEVIDLAV